MPLKHIQEQQKEVNMQDMSKSVTLKDLYARVKPAFRLTKLFSLGFGIILVSWLMAQLDWRATLDILHDIPPSLLLLGFLCYAASFYLRALRFKMLIPQEKPVKLLFPIVLVHYTALNIIPARLGEVSYVYLLKKINHVSIGYSLSTLLIARVFDQIAISLLFLIARFFVELPLNWLQPVILGVEVFLVITFTVFIVLLVYKETCLLLLEKVLHVFGLDSSAIVQRIMKEFQETVMALKQTCLRQKVAGLLGISLLIWFGIFGVNYFVLRAFHVSLSYIEIIMTSTCIILLGLLPIQILSGFGVRQTTWTFIAQALAIPKDIAITSAFGSHIVSTLFLVLLGIYGFVRLQKSSQLFRTEQHKGATHE